MKNNKGFTLIEIIIVVALISLTVLMFSNSFDGILSSQSSTAYERFTNNVSVAAETYLSASIEIKNEMEKGKGYVFVTIQELIENGLLDKDIVDPRTDEKVDRSETILIRLTCDGKYTYSYPVSNELINNITHVESIPIIVDTAPTNMFTDLNSLGLRMYNEAGAILSMTSKTNITQPRDIKYVSTTPQVTGQGVYDILYNYLDIDGVCKTHTRKLIINKKISNGILTPGRAFNKMAVYPYNITSEITFQNKINIPNGVTYYDLSEDQGEGVIAFYVDDGLENGTFELVVQTNRDKIIFNANQSNLIMSFSKLKRINNLHLVDTSNVINMERIISQNPLLEELDLSSWDTSNVTNMYAMFYMNYNMASVNLSNFDTRNVTTMGAMFGRCTSLVNLDLSSFETPLLTNMFQMFEGSSSLVTINMKNMYFGLVTETHGIFYISPGALTTVIVKDSGAKTFMEYHISIGYAPIRGASVVIG